MRVNRKFEGNVGVRILQFRGGNEGLERLRELISRGGTRGLES